MKQTEQQEQAYRVLLAGVDTLILNVRYADSQGRALKQELVPELAEQFDQWQAQAKQEEGLVATPLCFHNETLHIYPHGAGKGQWRWLLTCPAFTLSVGRGRLNGVIAQVRFSSEYLWSSQWDDEQDVAGAMIAVMDFCYEVFGMQLAFQVSEVHLCADILGWDVASCDWQQTFLSRARQRIDRAEEMAVGGAAVAVVSGRRLATLQFGSHGSPLSGVIYNKCLEIRQRSHGKVWFHDLWQRVTDDEGNPVWNGETDVWRVEFRFKREALHELKEKDVFHGIEEPEDLINHLEALWTYAAGHVGRAADGLPDGWLRYAVPSDDTNLARWSVHPVWVLVQGAFCGERQEVIDTTTGEVITAPASSVGSLIRERKRQVNIMQLVRQIAGCTSTLSAWLGGHADTFPEHATVGLADDGRFEVPTQIFDYHYVLHWLHDQMARYALSLEAARVHPEHPELIWEKYAVKFAEDVYNKRVLYGLQAA
jgi:hypothetical protein